MSERLHKVLAHAGVASRRAAERLIREHRVRVNGSVVAELGVQVDPRRDRIEVDGRPLPRTRAGAPLHSLEQTRGRGEYRARSRGPPHRGRPGPTSRIACTPWGDSTSTPKAWSC